MTVSVFVSVHLTPSVRLIMTPIAFYYYSIDDNLSLQSSASSPTFPSPGDTAVC